MCAGRCRWQTRSKDSSACALAVDLPCDLTPAGRTSRARQSRVKRSATRSCFPVAYGMPLRIVAWQRYGAHPGMRRIRAVRLKSPSTAAVAVACSVFQNFSPQIKYLVLLGLWVHSILFSTCQRMASRELHSVSETSSRRYYATNVESHSK